MRRLLLLLPLLVACGAPADTGGPTQAASSKHTKQPRKIAWALERTFGAGGPAQLSLRVQRTQLDLSQDLVVEEELRLDPGFVGDLPDVLPGDLDGLGLRKVEDLPTRTEDGHTVKTHRLHLEPERTGEVAINERWAFFRRASEPAKQEKPLATERIPLQVDPVPADVDLTMPAAPGLVTEETVRGRPERWAWLAGVGVLAAAGVLLWRRRRRGRPEPPPPPAHLVAREALSRLDALGLLEEGRLDEYFVYLSAILREYVERRFGIRAPERTTQEFLSEVRSDRRLAVHRALLAGFLEQADAVKFAGERPQVEAAREARDTVEEFVAGTQEASPPAEPPPPASSSTVARPVEHPAEVA